MGQSAVASAAYRAGEKLHDDRMGMTHDFTRKENVVYSEIMTPDGVDPKFKNRETLWNEMEKAETRKNSRPAKEIEIALPKELTLEQNKKLVQNFIKKNFVEKGMIADFSIHDKEGNPHAHIMLTTRKVDKNGISKNKNREWDTKATLKEWRKNWEVSCNKALERAGFEEKISCETLKAQGVDRIPQIHVGVFRTQERKKINNAIIQQNEELEKVRKEINKLLSSQQNVEFIQENKAEKQQNVEFIQENKAEKQQNVAKIKVKRRGRKLLTASDPAESWKENQKNDMMKKFFGGSDEEETETQTQERKRGKAHVRTR